MYTGHEHKKMTELLRELEDLELTLGRELFERVDEQNQEVKELETEVSRLEDELSMAQAELDEELAKNQELENEIINLKEQLGEE